jgi:hypothetical protein
MLLAACGDDTATTGGESTRAGEDETTTTVRVCEEGGWAQIVGSIDVEDQSSDGTTVVISEASIPCFGGFISIQAEPGRTTRTSLGWYALPAPTSLPSPALVVRDVVLTLDEPVATGDYWAVLIIDGDRNGRFEGLNDAALVVGGQAVEARFHLTVE